MNFAGYLALVFAISVGLAILGSVGNFDGGGFTGFSGPSSSGSGASDALRPNPAPPPSAATSWFEQVVSPVRNLVSPATVPSRLVRIRAVERAGASPDVELLEIENISNFALTITGWTIATSFGRATIAQGYEEFYLRPDIRPIVFRPGMRAKIRTGSSPLAGSYRENQCTNRLDERYASPNLHVEYFITCITQAKLSGAHLLNTWRIFLGRTAKLYPATHDRVRLYDERGNLMDEFVY